MLGAAIAMAHAAGQWELLPSPIIRGPALSAIRTKQCDKAIAEDLTAAVRRGVDGA